MGAEEIVPEKPVKEQIREQKRSVDRSKRSLEREKKKLEREKTKMLKEIKKMAQKGQTTGAKMLAKDIVRATNQIKKLEQFVGQLSAVSMRISACSSLNELGDAMNNAAKAMTLVSNKLDTKKLQQMAKVLAKEDMKLDMKSDMMSDVMDSIGESMDNEEEQEELYNQVLAEAGVKIEGEMVGAGKESLASAEKTGPQKQLAGVGAVGGGAGGDAGEDDLDAMLKSLNQK
jgi:hypothetical protein